MRLARRAHLIGGATSGIMAALALPPFDLWPLAFVALVPLARALSDPEPDEAVRTGFAFGAAYYGILLHWVPITLHGVVPLGALSGVLFLGIMTGLGGAQALVLRELIVRRGVPVALALPVVFAGTELLLAHLGPLSVPWISLSLSLSSVPEMAGIAEWVGATGVTFWIAAVNGGASAALGAASFSPRALAIALATILLGVAPAHWGIRRAERLALVPLPPMLVAQLAIPREDLVDSARRDARASAGAERAVSEVERAEGPSPVLAVFPEAPWASAWSDTLEEELRGYAERLGSPLLAGVHLGPSGAGLAPAVGGRRNVAILVDASGVEQAGAGRLGTPSRAPSRLVHAKVRLVPGVERPGLIPGPGGGVLQVEGLSSGVLICFEVAFAADARRYRAAGAELLLNPSNDSWFRPNWEGVGSFAMAQHRAHLVLRTIETRMGAVRSSVGGELLVVEPTGRVALSRPAGGEGIERVVPTTTRIVTGFVRFGDWVGWLSLLLLGAMLLQPPGPRGNGSLRAPRTPAA
ncbi:MAG: hypothetical protein EXR92_01685 [Gemmatimonadetes bacterium]|nr:hypothetical protein [Gemmatimonadota bacterium]